MEDDVAEEAVLRRFRVDPDIIEALFVSPQYPRHNKVSTNLSQRITKFLQHAYMAQHKAGPFNSAPSLRHSQLSLQLLATDWLSSSWCVVMATSRCIV